MEIILESTCNRRDEMFALKNKIEECLNLIFIQLGLHSLKKIVVTDHDTNIYIETIKEYVGNIDKQINITNTNDYQGAAVVIEGIDEEGVFTQLLFIKDFMYFAFLVDLLEIDQSQIGEMPRGKVFFFHEIGHAINNQTLFENYGHTDPQKTFNLRFEYGEYVKHEALLIWSEYYAEIIASCFSDSQAPMYLNNLENSIDILFPDLPNEQLHHSYRVAYHFAHYIAYYHYNNLEIPLFKKCSTDNKIYKYINVFSKLAKLLNDLLTRYDTWDFECDSNYLSNVYNELILLERNLYTH